MPVHYSLPGVELYLMSPGLPGNYTGSIINGSDQSYIIDNFGETVNQFVATEQVSLTLQVKKWHANTEIICHHELLPGMFTRIVLSKKQKEKIKGVGTTDLGANQFYSLTGSNFTSAMAHEEAGEYSNMGLWWSTAFLRDVITDYPELQKKLTSIIDDFPEKIIAPPLSLTGDMISVIDELLAFNYTGPGINKFLHEKMKKLARMIIRESMELDAIKRGSVEKNWTRLQNALEIIIADPIRIINTEELGRRVGLSAATLRNGVKEITGMAFAEFCRNRMLIEAARQIRLNKALVKNLSKDAGYADESDFRKEFKALFWCKPVDWRVHKKQLQLSSDYSMSIEDKRTYGSLIARYMSERETNEDIDELNKWLDSNDHHIRLFNQLVDDTKTAWTKQWFEAAGIKHDKIRWTKDGGWYRYDLSRDEQIEFYKYAILTAIFLIIFNLMYS